MLDPKQGGRGLGADVRPKLQPPEGADLLTPAVKALAELVEHDPELVVGILGGSAGTTRDTFELLARAQAQGAQPPCGLRQARPQAG